MMRLLCGDIILSPLRAMMDLGKTEEHLHFDCFIRILSDMIRHPVSH